MVLSQDYFRIYRRTLAGTAIFTGKGIHSGDICTLTLTPAPAGTGIVFKRKIGGTIQSIPADFATVTDTKLCTKLTQGTVHIATVEHLMGTLCVLGVDDVYIDSTSEEIPIMDGSALDFMTTLQGLGTTDSTVLRTYAKITQSVSVSAGDSTLEIAPCDGYSIDATIDFDHVAIGRQNYTIDFNCPDFHSVFAKEIAPARTFGFREDVEKLKAMGLAKGGSENTAVIYDQTGACNALRFDNECIRHKILDVVGDLALFSAPLLGAVTGYKMGHSINNTLLRKIYDTPNSYEIITLDT